jgi:hypothetical protein
MRLALLWCLTIYSVIKAVEIVANSPTGSAVLNAVLGAHGLSSSPPPGSPQYLRPSSSPQHIRVAAEK